MKFLNRIGFLVIIGMILAACQPTVTATATSVPSTPLVVTATPEVPTMTLPTVTVASIATEAPTATAIAVTVTNVADASASVYLDDRSTPASLVLSFVNAINRHEYLRAYSYWASPSASLGTLDAFAASLANTAFEAVSFGQVISEGAAGSVYYTVPVAEIDTLTGGSTAKFADCFILRFPQPGNYGAPPITPMHIDRFTKTTVSAATSDTDAIASACSSSDYPTGISGAAASVESLSDLSATNYIDNRSGAIELVSSLMNALNRKEYVRAYSYWQNPATSIGAYDNYAAGFNDTGSVTVTFGTVVSDAGAGQLHYQVPLAMNVITTSNTQQVFVGCYTLHLANPAIQSMMPFQPLGIVNGKFTKVANGVNVTPLLTTACN